MNKLIFFIILILPIGICSAQNLVLNGGFEQYSSCPTSVAQLDSSTFWQNPANIFGGGSPDYFNVCSGGSNVGVPYNAWGYQQPHGGLAYCGLNLIYYNYANFREYAEGQLISPLFANKSYVFEMYINTANASKYATDALGIYFSDTVITGFSNFNTLNFIPQINNVVGSYISDTANWVLFSAIYLAHGGENYFLIGNFKDDINTSTILTNNSGSMANGYMYIDDVSLTLLEKGTGTEQINDKYHSNLFPNPFENKLTVELENNEHSQIILYDFTSRVILQQEFINSVTLNTEQLPKGIYLYELKSNNHVIRNGKVVKY